MTEQQIERIVSDLLGQYGWMFIIGITVLTFKEHYSKICRRVLCFLLETIIMLMTSFILDGKIKKARNNYDMA